MSHCREDAGELVLPVYDRLLLRDVSPWLDHHDYPLGPTSVQALQDGILKSRHVVFFITPSFARMMEEPGLIERVTTVQPEPIFFSRD